MMYCSWWKNQTGPLLSKVRPQESTNRVPYSAGCSPGYLWVRIYNRPRCGTCWLSVKGVLRHCAAWFSGFCTFSYLCVCPPCPAPQWLSRGRTSYARPIFPWHSARAGIWQLAVRLDDRWWGRPVPVPYAGKCSKRSGARSRKCDLLKESEALGLSGEAVSWPGICASPIQLSS